MPEASTPLMRQYHAAKQQNPEALLLFRLGDFYELFYDDAVTAARALQITLTARGRDSGSPVPMCGVPYHAAEGYIAKLIAQGFKVALCEQMEDPANTKTLVRREVTRVLTPGTAATHLDAGENRYLAAVARSNTGAGLALLDVSTGEFRATAFTGPDSEVRLGEELARWRPREILHAAEAPLFREARPEEFTSTTLTAIDAWQFEPSFAQSTLESHFGVLSLEGFGLADKPLAAAAAGVIVHYVKQTQHSQLVHVDRLGYFERQHGLILDAVTARNLELVEPVFAAPGDNDTPTLRSVLDATVTPMGKRLLRQWILRPSANLAEINDRQQAVATFVDQRSIRERLRSALDGIQDLERLLGRVALSTALPRDLLALGASLDRIPDVTAALDAPEQRLATLAAALDDCRDLRQAIATHMVESPPATLADGGYIRPGVNPQLDECRVLSHDAKTIIAAIESRERERTSIASLKVRFNNIFGYYIEVSKANLRHVPAGYERKQTLVNAERFTTPELKDLERKILSADERSRELELELFTALRAQAAAHAPAIRANAAALAELDVLANFAHLAVERAYCRPSLGHATFETIAGRHPVIERISEADRFVPNDLHLDREAQRLLLITGPNMGGKSTYLRQTALIVLMAQMGSFVPASSARLPLVDRIFTRIGASDNLARGRSTFMVEMTEAAVILNQATSASLVLLDEIGRGTSTYDGLALAWAMVEHLHHHNQCWTLFATHYHELTALAGHLPAVRNVHVEARETPQGVVFLRKVSMGEASRSYGIEVAKLAGLPREVIERARQVLRSHESAPPPVPESQIQLTLFTPLTQQVVDRLLEADLNSLSPLDALNLLATLQRQIRESKS